MSATVPLRLAGITHASELRAAIESAVVNCLAQAYRHPPALVLAGSLARDEATFLDTGSRWRLLGDAEFLLFCARRRELPAPARLDEISRRAMAWLQARGVDAKIEISACTLRYLRRMPPHQFGFELRRHGRVLLGPPRLLQSIPRFSNRQVPPDDAFRLLCNRLLEWLEHAPVLSSSTPAEPPASYARLKLLLDMATSYLVFLGQYASTYQRRADRLLALDAAAARQAPWDLQRFARLVQAATVWKLSLHRPEEGMPAELPSGRELLHAAHALWRWEAARLLRLAPQTGDAEIMQAWARRQPRSQRCRGWLWTARSGFRSRLRPLPWRHWLRLSWCGSPRACVYRAGLALLFEPPPLSPRRLLELAKLLPLSGAARNRQEISPPELAREVSWNYRLLLAPTRH